MTKESRWSQVSSGLVLLSFIVILTGCTKVIVRMAPSEAEVDSRPKGNMGYCVIVNNACQRPGTGNTCTCRG